MLPPSADALQTLLERGEDAARLLADETFLRVLQDLQNYHLVALTNAPPGIAAQGARDHHHVMLHALNEITANLHGQAEAASLHLENAKVDDEESILSQADQL